MLYWKNRLNMEQQHHSTKQIFKSMLSGSRLLLLLSMSKCADTENEQIIKK